MAQFADGSAESPSALAHRCPRCQHTFAVPARAVASLVIEKQTTALFDSISQLIRGNAKLQ